MPLAFDPPELHRGRIDVPETLGTQQLQRGAVFRHVLQLLAAVGQILPAQARAPCRRERLAAALEVERVALHQMLEGPLQRTTAQRGESDGTDMIVLSWQQHRGGEVGVGPAAGRVAIALALAA